MSVFYFPVDPIFGITCLDYRGNFNVKFSKTFHILENVTCGYIQFPNHPQKRHRQPCGATLLKRVLRCNDKNVSFCPIKEYCYRSVKDSVQDLFRDANFFNRIYSRRVDSSNDSVMMDIFDGKVVKEFKDNQGKLFFKDKRNIGFMLNFDFFNPYENSQYSLGLIYLVVINLPREERFKWENVIIVGVIPGPEEPKLDINPFLRPMVEELLIYWNGVILEENGVPCQFKFALVLISSDLPATRKCGGFLSFMANKGKLANFAGNQNNIRNLEFGIFEG